MASTPFHRRRHDLVMVSTPLYRGRHDLVVDSVHSTPPRETRLVVDQSYGDMRVAAVFRVDAMVEVSTPLHRGRQDWVGRCNYRSVHSTPPRETRLIVDQSCGEMCAAAVFRVDAIVEGRRNRRGVHSTPLRGTGLGCTSTGVTCVSLLSSG
ncbi:hypothetical protein GQ457_08G016240 [Hibiscus cannabinus]